MSKEKYHFLVKVDSGNNDRLIPAMDEDKNFILGLEDGEMVKVSSGDVRSQWRHRKFFLLLKRVLEYLPDYLNDYDINNGINLTLSDRFKTPEVLLLELKLQLGYMDIHVSMDGRQIWTATSSISFACMGEAKFKEFVNECRGILTERFLPDISKEEFDNNFLSLIFD